MSGIYSVRHTYTEDGETESYIGLKWSTNEVEVRTYFKRVCEGEVFEGETLELLDPHGNVIDTFVVPCES